MTTPGDPMSVAVRVARALENAGVDYAVGGSVASSAYGEPRATRDLDFAIRLTPQLLPALLEALGPEFVVDADLLREGIRTGSSVNIFFMPFFTKIDLFIRGDDEYDRAEFSRLRAIEVAPGEQILASSAEDTSSGSYDGFGEVARRRISSGGISSDSSGSAGTGWITATFTVGPTPTTSATYSNDRLIRRARHSDLAASP